MIEEFIFTYLQPLYILILYLIVITLAHKNKHNVLKYILVIILILYAFGFIYYTPIPAFIYLIYLLIRKIIRRKKKPTI